MCLVTTKPYIHTRNRRIEKTGAYILLYSYLFLFYVVIPLDKQGRGSNSESKAVQDCRAEGTAVKAESELIQVGLQIFFGTAMISAQDKRLGIADNNVQPMKHTRIGGIYLMLMLVIFQSWDITAITVAADGTVISKCRFSKAFDRILSDIGVTCIFR